MSNQEESCLDNKAIERGVVLEGHPVKARPTDEGPRFP